MDRSRLSEVQIIAVLKEHRAGRSAAKLCRQHGISDATVHCWRSKFGGNKVSAARTPFRDVSHNLRYELIRANENPAQFKARIDRLAADPEAEAVGDNDGWVYGALLRKYHAGFTL